MADRDFARDIAFFFAGMGVGASVALLLAPYSGRHTRRLIRRQGEDAREYVAEKGREVYDRGRELADDARRFVERSVKEVTE